MVVNKNSIVVARGLVKSYGDLTVLKQMDVDIEAESVVAVTGPSGAGKSTLLHLLGTLDKPDVGSLSINGQDILQMKSRKLANFRNQHIGFIFQFHHLLPEFTALENVSIPGFIGERRRSEVEKRAKELLDYLNLSSRFDHKPGELSGGEQQRVAVARALMNSPEVIFADEPSGNLDTQSANELHQLFFKLRKEFKQTFVIVTHNPLLAEMSDRQIKLVDGYAVD